ncbi:MAG: neutral zinc metallopeptidase [Acidimicrobiales bacterium]
MRHRLPSVALAAILFVACAGGATPERSAIERDRDASGEDEAERTGLEFPDVADDNRDDAIVEVAIAEIERFWGDELPAVYDEEFEPVDDVIAYGPNRDEVPCGNPPPDYDDIAGNAFYCPFDDLIAYDTDNLTDDLIEEFGPFSLVIVMAHEYGHAIQDEVGFGGERTIEFEQQADCFAGAFTRFVTEGNAQQMTAPLTDLDQSVAGFVSFRDELGISVDDFGAHGSAFDRVGAFQDGFRNGASRCAAYEDDPPPLPDLPLDQGDPGGGTAPFGPGERGDIFDISFTFLEEFWELALPQHFDQEWEPYAPDRIEEFDSDNAGSEPDCPDVAEEDMAGSAFYCSDEDFVAYDLQLMEDLYDDIGDFAVSSVIARQYSVGVQDQLGIRERSLESSLQADCFTGAWAAQVAADTLSVVVDDDEAGMSARDLDEAVVAFLLQDEAEGTDDTGSPFERVAAFRDGFVDGLPSCVTYLEGGAPGDDG